MRKRTTFPASGGGNGQGGGACAAFDPALAFPSGITTRASGTTYIEVIEGSFLAIRYTTIPLAGSDRHSTVHLAGPNHERTARRLMNRGQIPSLRVAGRLLRTPPVA
jgi:hypothetical protein